MLLPRAHTVCEVRHAADCQSALLPEWGHGKVPFRKPTSNTSSISRVVPRKNRIVTRTITRFRATYHRRRKRKVELLGCNNAPPVISSTSHLSRSTEGEPACLANSDALSTASKVLMISSAFCLKQSPMPSGTLTTTYNEKRTEKPPGVWRRCGSPRTAWKNWKVT